MHHLLLFWFLFVSSASQFLPVYGSLEDFKRFNIELCIVFFKNLNIVDFVFISLFGGNFLCPFYFSVVSFNFLHLHWIQCSVILLNKFIDVSSFYFNSWCLQGFLLLLEIIPYICVLVLWYHGGTYMKILPSACTTYSVASWVVVCHFNYRKIPAQLFIICTSIFLFPENSWAGILR